MSKGIYNKELGLIIRTDSEFNIQADLFQKLKEVLDP